MMSRFASVANIARWHERPFAGESVKHPSRHRGLGILAFAGLLSFALQACMLVDGGQPIAPSGGPTGYVGLDISLQQNRNALLKAAAGDTTFELDSLIVVLRAAGQATQVHSIPVAGRADT